MNYSVRFSSLNYSIVTVINHNPVFEPLTLRQTFLLDYIANSMTTHAIISTYNLLENTLLTHSDNDVYEWACTENEREY